MIRRTFTSNLSIVFFIVNLRFISIVLFIVNLRFILDSLVKLLYGSSEKKNSRCPL